MSQNKGRPKSDNPKEIRFSIRLDNDINLKLINYCEEKNISKGEAIRNAIKLLLGIK